jgi:predicted dehydrogenase
VLADSRVDAVYIATPHPLHADAIRQCLLSNKPVLCEKPLVTNAKTAVELCALSTEKNIFLMEAVWTRFLPIYDAVGEWLRAATIGTIGTIGTIRSMQSSFCFNSPWNPQARHFDPAQAGGALLDIGIYNLTVTRWALTQALGHCPNAVAIHANAVIGPTGVDHRVTASMQFIDGITSQFVCGFDGTADNAFHIFGEHGSIAIHAGFWQATTATLTKTNEAPITIARPFRINGFEYEIEEAMRCIRDGRIESERMTHQETIETLRWMDHIRAEIGVKYPFE